MKYWYLYCIHHNITKKREEIEKLLKSSVLELFFWGNGQSGKCPIGKLSNRGNGQSGKCPVGGLSSRENGQSGKCPVGELSVGELSGGETVSRGTVRSG